MSSLDVAITIASTRPRRNGTAVASWVLEHAAARGTASYTVVDLADLALPMLEEPVPALAGRYENPHTKDWSATIAPYDGFVFVTPEYKHSTYPALLNALDYLYAEWNDQVSGFVSYGTSYGVRAVGHLRGVVGELQRADV